MDREINELPSAGEDFTGLWSARDLPVTDVPRAYIHIWDVHNGKLLAELDDDSVPRPLDITFDSEDRFYFHHDTHRILPTLSPLRAVTRPYSFDNPSRENNP
jgi:hypothetical protein